MNTISLTDYELKSPTLARVILSFTGKFSKEQVRAAFSEMTNNRMAIVDDSFQEVRANVAVGFVRANREIRIVDDQAELRASYRAMGSSNIMMSEVDNSLWEVKKGKGGTYLARHGHEDLSELMTAHVQRRTDVTRLAQLSTASTTPGEFISYVTASGDMDHGFVVQANSTKAKIVSYARGESVVVGLDMVTAMSRVPLKKSFVQKMLTAGISREDKNQANEYWKQLYSYDPAYLSDVIKQVNEGTMA
jgi:hypothetical protein